MSESPNVNPAQKGSSTRPVRTCFDFVKINFQYFFTGLPCKFIKKPLFCC